MQKGQVSESIGHPCTSLCNDVFVPFAKEREDGQMTNGTYFALLCIFEDREKKRSRVNPKETQDDVGLFRINLCFNGQKRQDGPGATSFPQKKPESYVLCALGVIAIISVTDRCFICYKVIKKIPRRLPKVNSGIFVLSAYPQHTWKNKGCVWVHYAEIYMNAKRQSPAQPPRIK